MATNKLILIVSLFVLIAFFSCTQRKNSEVVTDEFSGSQSCRQCHERFYQLWEPSFHGKAMQPVKSEFIKEYQLPESSPMVIEGKSYQIIYEDSSMVMTENENDVQINRYKIEWSLGGRNVFTFLVPLDKGKLQTIPLAYDVNRGLWFNYPESAIRHFVDMSEDEALPWRDRMYTFNTGCYNCHVSQLSSNFDLETETYQTTWREAGINCETCHGPSAEHVRIFTEAKEGEVPENMGLIVTSTFTPEQHDASCAPCHAKASPVTSSYMPGEPFYDHFNLATLEDPDFYPDGRDLGENYTMTGWEMNACQTNSDMHCVTCHTSSGRNRFKDNPNQACIGCHTEREGNLTEHTMHPADSPGSTCINCHAPSREFVGHFIRSDHSFRPPMPEATIRFGSPNACNQCHDDKPASWANAIVKKRPNGNYQEETLYWAELIKEARENRWNRLNEMLQIIDENRYNDIVAASFVRLLANCPNDSKWETITRAMTESSSPLVRAAAATTSNGRMTNDTRTALVKAASDELRLVRVSAAASLAGFDDNRFTEIEKEVVTKATEEYMASILARPDDWSSHYNMAIYHQNEGDVNKALHSYETAARLYPESLMPLINSSVLYSYLGNQAKAEENLKKVLEFDPENEAASLNLGLLLAEQGKLDAAESALRTALKANPEQAVAAYNLSVIVSRKDLREAVEFAKIAAISRPDDPKYGYTLAYYLMENSQESEAVKTLQKLISDHPTYLNAVSFLAEIYRQNGEMKKVEQLYRETLKKEGIPEQDRQAIEQALNAIQKDS